MLGKTINGIYYVEGLEYKFPEKPNNKDIINYGLPRKLQKWKRITDYEKFDWSEGWENRMQNPETEEDYQQIQYLSDEIDRISEGIWIYINGEATYFNADTYFFLNWYLLPDDGIYPEYRDSCLYYYRFLEIVDNTKLCTGHTLIKGRRLGATSMVISKILRKMLTTKRKNFGITSKTSEDAGPDGGAFSFLVSAFESLPIFLKPDIEGNTNPKKVLSFRKQAKRISSKNKHSSDDDAGLMTKSYWRAPGMNTFDSGAYEIILIDESGKFDSKKTKVNINEYLPVVTKCVKKGAKVSGKLYLPTTVNPPSEGGANYKVIWTDSNQEKCSYLRETISGLYRILIPAYYGFLGYVGEFGESIWDTPTEEQRKYLSTLDICPNPNIGAKQYLEEYRKRLEGREEDLQKEIQMNPFNAEEVFESANNRCIFDLNRLNKREKELEDKLEELGRNPLTDELGRRGWFIKQPSGKVRFDDDPKGLWYIHKLLSDSEANKFEIKFGVQVPTNEQLGAGGLDPIRAGDATVDKGSDGCLIIRERYNSLDPANSGIPIAMFLGRMSDSRKFHEQLFNGLIFYGVKMLAERSPLNWLDYAEDNGLTGYLYGTKRSDGTEVKGIPNQQSENTKQDHAECQKFAAEHDIEYMPFITIIRQRKYFSINNRTEWDTCMADGYASMGLKVPFKKPVQKVPEKPMIRQGKITTW